MQPPSAVEREEGGDQVEVIRGEYAKVPIGWIECADSLD
jgi:hypothetical protein